MQTDGKFLVRCDGEKNLRPTQSFWFSLEFINFAVTCVLLPELEHGVDASLRHHAAHQVEVADVDAAVLPGGQRHRRQQARVLGQAVAVLALEAALLTVAQQHLHRAGVALEVEGRAVALLQNA